MLPFLPVVLIVAHAPWQGIRRPRKAERKRIRKQTDDTADASDGRHRTAAERVQEQLGFANDAEGRHLLCIIVTWFSSHCETSSAHPMMRTWDVRRKGHQ